MDPDQQRSQILFKIQNGLNGGSYDVTIVDKNNCSFTISNIAVGSIDYSVAGLDQIVCSNSATLAGSVPGLEK